MPATKKKTDKKTSYLRKPETPPKPKRRQRKQGSYSKIIHPDGTVTEYKKRPNKGDAENGGPVVYAIFEGRDLPNIRGTKLNRTLKAARKANKKDNIMYQVQSRGGSKKPDIAVFYVEWKGEGPPPKMSDRSRWRRLPKMLMLKHEGTVRDESEVVPEGKTPEEWGSWKKRHG